MSAEQIRRFNFVMVLGFKWQLRSIARVTIAILACRRFLNTWTAETSTRRESFRSPASIVRLEDARVFPPLALLYEWRERLQRAIDSRFAPETAGVLDAALLGNRYNLSRDASERFREGGTFHVLVISGLHISFIGARGVSRRAAFDQTQS